MDKEPFNHPLVAELSAFIAAAGARAEARGGLLAAVYTTEAKWASLPPVARHRGLKINGVPVRCGQVLPPL